MMAKNKRMGKSGSGSDDAEAQLMGKEPVEDECDSSDDDQDEVDSVNPATTILQLMKQKPDRETLVTLAISFGITCSVGLVLILFISVSPPAHGLILASIIHFTMCVAGIEHLPGNHLNTAEYLKSNATKGYVEKPDQLVSGLQMVCCRGNERGYSLRKVPIYYEVVTEGGQCIVIRKVLKSSLFYGPVGIVDPSTGRRAAVLRLLTCRDEPFSAYPRHLIVKHRRRRKQWNLYGFPLWLVMSIVLAYTIRRAYHLHRNNAHDHFHVYIAAIGIVYFTVLTVLAYKQRKWKFDASNGGTEERRLSSAKNYESIMDWD